MRSNIIDTSKRTKTLRALENFDDLPSCLNNKIYKISNEPALTRLKIRFTARFPPYRMSNNILPA